MAGMLRVPRSRGALNGVLLVLLGLWGGLIAFVLGSPTPPAVCGSRSYPQPAPWSAA